MKIVKFWKEDNMDWTTERRYRLYEDWTKKKSNKFKKIWSSLLGVQLSYRTQQGLLNDPNGFSYFDGKWIVFYQNFPLGAAHGLKSWVSWKVMIWFISKLESKFCLIRHWIADAYSGSAMQFGDKLVLILYRKCS